MSRSQGGGNTERQTDRQKGRCACLGEKVSSRQSKSENITTGSTESLHQPQLKLLMLMMIMMMIMMKEMMMMVMLMKVIMMMIMMKEMMMMTMLMKVIMMVIAIIIIITVNL